VFEVFDKLSGPAGRMGSSLKRTEKQLEDTNRALKVLDRQAAQSRIAKLTDPLEKQRAVLQLQKMDLEGVASGLKTAGLAAGGFATVLGGVATAAAGLALGGVGLGVFGAKFATETLMFKETTMTALEQMTGTQAEADRIFNQALQFAKKTPFETTDVLGGFTSLLGAGFKVDEVGTVFAAIGDAAAASGFDRQVVDRMIIAFSQIKAKGRLQGDEMFQMMEALGRAGVGTRKIYEQIAAVMKVPVDQVAKLQEQGKIDADSAIFGVLKALEARGGGAVGTIMDRQSKTLKGLLSTLSSAPADMFLSMDTKSAPGFQAIKGTVENLTLLFDTSRTSGQRTMEVLDKLFNGVMGRLFGDLAGAQGLERMEKALANVADRLQEAIPDLVRAAGTFVELAVAMGRVLDVALKLSAPVRAVAGAFLGDLGGGNIVEDPSAGYAMADGAAAGVLAGKGQLERATRDLALAGQQAFKDENEIHSPSRVFERYGRYTAEGYAQGVDAGSGGAHESILGLSKALPGALAGGGTTITVTAPITVHASGADLADGGFLAQLKAQVEAALAAALEGAALQGGMVNG
jgi:tape measure domain-containing protein